MGLDVRRGSTGLSLESIQSATHQVWHGHDVSRQECLRHNRAGWQFCIKERKIQPAACVMAR